jgi:hypothetical protein
MLFSKSELRTLKAKLVENAKERRLSKKVYYVYLLLDPRKPGPFTYGHWKFSHEPFYVGKGKKDRINLHNEFCTYNPLKANIIRRIKQKFDDCLKLIKTDQLTSREACKLEIKLITKIGRRDLKLGPLSNLTDGGEGAGYNRNGSVLKRSHEKRVATLRNKSPEEKARILEKKQATWRNKTEEEQSKISAKKSESCRNRTPEQKSALSLIRRVKRGPTGPRKTVKSVEEKLAHRKKLSDAHLNRSEESKLKTKEKLLKTLSLKSEEEKIALSKKKSESAKKRCLLFAMPLHKGKTKI